METQEILDTETGTKEFQSLSPKKIRILSVQVVPVNDKNGKLVGDKLVCYCKHPDAQDQIEISSVKYELKGKLKTSGLWIKMDEDKKLQKGSALVSLLTFMNCSKIRQLIDKEVDTALDENNFLCLKGY